MRTHTHILVVSQYFYPEQFRINDICTEWVKRGYKVTVLTGIPNYPQGKYFDEYSMTKNRTEEWNGIKIIRIPLIACGRNPIGIASNYLSFVISGYIWNIFTNIKADVIFNYEVSPMTQVLIGIWYAKKRNLPCYLYLTDLWPDNVEIVTGIHNRLLLFPINIMVNYIYRNCTKIFTSSNSFMSKLIERGVPKEKIDFWPQYAEKFYIPLESDNVALDEISQDNKFNILFAGNIGYAQGLEILVYAAEQLSTDKIEVKFNIVGDGVFKKELVGEVAKANVMNYFNFIDRQPAEKIPLYMAKSDAALICLSKSEVFSMTIPAKTQSCMACGKPILVVADGEVQKIIEDAACGYSSAALDTDALVQNIKQMSKLPKEELVEMGKRARHYYETNFNREKLLNKMDLYLRGEN